MFVCLCVLCALTCFLSPQALLGELDEQTAELAAVNRLSEARAAAAARRVARGAEEERHAARLGAGLELVLRDEEAEQQACRPPHLP